MDNKDLENSLSILNSFSVKMADYEHTPLKEDLLLFKEVCNFSKNNLNTIKKELVQNGLNGSVRILRYVFLEKLYRNEIKSPNEVQNIIEEIKYNYNHNNIDYFKPYLSGNYNYALKNVAKNSKNAFKNWGAYYRYLLPFVYSQQNKEDIWAALRNIIENILIKLNIQNKYECNNTQEIGHQIRSYYGFEGSSNYGSQDAIIMIHPQKIHDHKNAIQLVCYFHKGEINVGWDIGRTIQKNKSILNLLNLPKPSLVKVNSFNEIIKELEKFLPLVSKANNKLIDINSKEMDFDTTLDFPDIEQVKPIVDTTSDFKKISNMGKEQTQKKYSSKNNKPDWEKKTKFERKLGFRGEEIVLKFEREQLIKEGREDLANEIKQVSLEDDSLGYDILSFYKDGSKKFIEVKSTVANVYNFKKFYLSQYEYEKLESSKNNCIYLVLNANTRTPRIKEIPSISELEKQEKCKKQIETYSIHLQL